MAKKTLNVPFIDNEDGSRSFLSYPGWKCDFLYDPTAWKGSMRVEDTHRGRSAAQINWRDEETGNVYPMFLSDVFAMLKDADMKDGLITGYWKFVKKGSNYGVVYSKKPLDVQLSLPM